MKRRVVLTVRGWVTWSSVAWIQATGGGEGGPGSDQGGTICFNVFRSCLATVSTAKAQAGRSVMTSSVAEKATMVLLLWHLLNSAPIFSGVGRGGVYVGRVVNDSIMDKGMGMDLLPRSWDIRVNGKRSGWYRSQEGGLQLR